MNIQIENKLSFIDSINKKHAEKVRECQDLLNAVKKMLDDDSNEHIGLSMFSEYEEHIFDYNRIYNYLLKNICFIFDFIEKSDVLEYIILKEDLEESIKLSLVEKGDSYSKIISFYIQNYQNVILARIDIPISSMTKNQSFIEEEGVLKEITFEISEFDDGNTYEYTFFRNSINTDEHIKQFQKLQKYIFQSNFFIHSMKYIHVNDHHIYERIYFLTHSSFNKMSDFENLLYCSGSANGIKPSLEWDFIETLTHMIKRTSKIKNFNNQDIKYFLKVIRTINKLLEKTNIKHEYTLFSTETITSQYHLYVDRQNEIDICFDVDLNCNIRDLVNLKLYHHNYNRERIETNFTLSDYFYHKDEVIQNMKILGY